MELKSGLGMTVEKASGGPVIHLAYNFIYVTVFLATILVVVLAHKWTPQPRFTEYLSNATTLASLLLALVAIVYSFISSESISRGLGEVSSVARVVAESRDEVKILLAKAQELNQSADDNLQLSRQASEQIGSDLKSLGDVLSSMESGNETLQGTIGELRLRLGQIEGRFDGLEKILDDKRQPDHSSEPSSYSPNGLIDKEGIHHFLELSSLGENLLTLAIVRAYQNSKELSIEEFCKAIGLSVRNRAIGFLACMEAIGMIKSVTITTTPRIYEIEHVNKLLESESEQYIIDYLDRVREGNPEHYAKWSAKFHSIKGLCSS
jgi:hypothetical protein